MAINKREFLTDDTIAAIATPLGEGGISIIRISGKDSAKVASRLFRFGRKRKSITLHEFISHHVYYGYIVNPKSDVTIDEVLLTYMKSPKSYTKEDIVEISCHGGMLPARHVLDTILSEGVRLAAPGEFTKRAFLNGRIDLAQAESVIEVIRAKTEKSLAFASHQLSGDFSNEIMTIKEELVKMLAYFQAYIDFPEDDTEIKYENYTAPLESMRNKVQKFLLTYEEGKIFRNGISTTIVGKPNVGKSSLLNVLLKEERAIVTDIPGTTRDAIEEVVNIRGIPLRLIDTAGIRESKCVIESAGIKITKEKIIHADFVLFVIDAAAPIDDNDMEIYRLTSNKKKLIIVNKIDLAKDVKKLTEDIETRFGSDNIVYISAKEKENIEQLKDRIWQSVIQKKVEQEKESFLINSRHKEILSKTLSFIDQIYEGVQNRLFPELICVHITDALDSLGEVLGETTTDEVLDRIFSDFCIGK